MREELVSLHKQLIRLQSMVRDMTLRVERVLGQCKEPAEPEQPLGETLRIIERVVAHLNEEGNREFSAANLATRALIRERLAEGYTEEDLKTVITAMVKRWGDEPKMMIYIRPETLFGQHFESYLQEARGKARPSQLEILERRMIERIQNNA